MPKKKELYRVRCVECGDFIDNKFFSLENLLRQYSCGNLPQREGMIRMLNLGVMYGQPVFTEVPALVRQDPAHPGQHIFHKPNVDQLFQQAQKLNEFTCEITAIPQGKLVPIYLNMSSIIAQVYRMTNFTGLYDMLELKFKLERMDNSEEQYAVLAAKLDEYCSAFAKLPHIHIGAMATEALRRRAVKDVLAYMLNCAVIEAATPGNRNYAKEEMRAGWRYVMENGRRMPNALVVVGKTSSDPYHSAVCRCDKCRSRVPYQFGAYDQKILGLLGTQQTGKTTYLTALTDAIDVGEATSLIQSNGGLLSGDMALSHAMENDPQWERMEKKPGKGKVGAQWLYRHGFPPEKTDPQLGEAPVLTFLLEKQGAEPVMYTLADIPGEVFDPVERAEMDPAFVAKMMTLLASSNALLMVIHRDQLKDSPTSYGEATVAKSGNLILAGYQYVLTQKNNEPVPTAVVLTAADKIDEEGDLRETLHVAYDLKKVSPLVWSDRENTLVYNAEAMEAEDRAVSEYLGVQFSTFMQALQLAMEPAKGKKSCGMAAFLVSSGTQCATKTYVDALGIKPEDLKRPEAWDEALSMQNAGADPQYLLPGQMDKRYQRMCEERFGVTAPFLWLLAHDERLKVGRGNSPFHAHNKAVEELIFKKLKASIYH